MYIHSYQIHNVLNAYRKQLSSGSGTKMRRPAPSAPLNDNVEISGNGQRQSLIDQVSAEIVQRLADSGPQQRFQSDLNSPIAKNVEGNTHQAAKRETEFTYTVIDERNRKSTNTLAVEKLSPLIEQQS